MILLLMSQLSLRVNLLALKFVLSTGYFELAFNFPSAFEASESRVLE
jgi:hypothetical protein